MPSAKIVSCSSAPPEKTLMRANRLLFSPVEAAWTAAYTLLAGVMIAAAAEG